MSFNIDNALEDVASHFSIRGEIVSCEKHGNGNVNDTFLVKCQEEGEENLYTLQKINHHVFKNPVALMRNFERVTSHLLQKSLEQNRGEEVLTLIPSMEGNSYFQEAEGNFWRMTKFIEGGRSYDVPENEMHAFEAAKAFGRFQSNLNDLGGSTLVETIPDFHHTRKRFDRFKEVYRQDSLNRVCEVKELVEFALSNEALADAIHPNDFPTRVVHNDTKLNNVLLHKTTGKGICVVDLDTVMPGCALHDFGDLVRTASSSALEDEPDEKKIHFLPNRFNAIVDGYISGTGDMLNEDEIEALPIAPIVITYELGIRFLTDYLEGDVYFKIKHHDHNKDRVRAQFALVQSMLRSFEEMKRIVFSKK